jgi:septation ring formation regulator EzrA
MRAIDARIKDLKTSASRLRGDDNAARRESIDNEIETLKGETDALAATIPDAWGSANKDFVKLTRAEGTARMKYRRAADDAYKPVGEVASALATTKALRSVREELDVVQQLVDGAEFGAAATALRTLKQSADGLARVGRLASDINTALSALQTEDIEAEETAKADVAKATAALASARKLADEELVWRQSIEPVVVQQLLDYETELKDTLGIRSQNRMTREQALFVAACSANHTDVSLNF